MWLYTVETETWKMLVKENGVGWDFDWSPDSRKNRFFGPIFSKTVENKS